MKPFRLLLFLFAPILMACVAIQPQTSTSSTASEASFTGSPSLEATEQADAIQAETSTTLSPTSALERLFTGTLQAEEWFVGEFLNEVPAEQIADLIAQLTEQLGAFVSVEGETNPYTVVFELGTLPAEI